MPDAYSYVRFSTPEQWKGDSIRRQTKMSELFALEHGLTLKPGFKDYGKSAFRGANRTNGDLRRFLDAVEDGRIAKGSYLLVESLDRLSRDRIGEALPEFLNLLKAGIIVATLQDKRIYDHRSIDDPMQLVGSLIVMSRAHEESARKSQLTREAWIGRRQKGLKQAACPAWLKLSSDGQTYEFIDYRVSVLREIYEMAAQGLGSFTIARILNERGTEPFSREIAGKPLPGKPARGWHAATILDLLSSRNVLGEMQPYHRDGYNKVPAGDPIKDYYPAAIDEATFLRAQAARKKTGKTGGRKGRAYSNMLGDLAVCARCGGPMQISHGARQTRKYLRCGNAANGIKAKIKCEVGGTYFNLRDVEHYILHHVKEYRLSELFANPETDAELRAVETNMAAYATSIAELERQQRNIMRAVAMLEDGDPILEDYNKMLREQRVEIGQIKDQVKLMQDRRAELMSQIDNRADVEMTVVENRMMLKALQDEELYFLDNRIMNAAELAEVHKQMLPIRAKLATALRQFIERVEFDQASGQFDVIVAGGNIRYRFQRSGYKSRINGVNNNFRASGIRFVSRVSTTVSE